MWAEAFARVCRRHPDLIAVYESRHGTLALLLRHSSVPLSEKRGQWFSATRRAARAVIGSLRAAGLEDEVVVLQWSPPAEAAHIVRTWACRYDADPVVRERLTGFVVEAARDGASPWKAAPPRPRGLAENPTPPGPLVGRGLTEWYRDMAPCWLGVEPPLRRQLVLRTHRWIVGRILGPAARGRHPSMDDVRPDGALPAVLARVVPPGELAVWRPWIWLVVADLRRALGWPVARRDEAWVRWLFLIPYSIPVNLRRAAHAQPPEASGTR